MHSQRLTLDNPVFAGRLRYTHRSPAYVRRPVPRSEFRIISDIVAVKPQPRAAAVATKPIAKPRRAVISPAKRPTPALPRTSKSKVLNRTAVRPLTKTRKRRSVYKRSGGSKLLTALAVVLFTAGALVSAKGFMANQAVEAQANNLAAAAETVTKIGSTNTGSHNVSIPPSTKKPTAWEVQHYAVAPNQPRYLDIPKLGVHSRVRILDTKADGELSTPNNTWDTGWAQGSSLPGQPGATVIDGHSGVGLEHGVFHDLPDLKRGDKLIITRGDGKKLTYLVVDVRIVDAKKVDMGLLFGAAGPKPGLNLITCTGDRINGTNELNQRVMVRSELS